MLSLKQASSHGILLLEFSSLAKPEPIFVALRLIDRARNWFLHRRHL